MGLGVVLGVAGAVGLTQLISSLLFGVETLDATVFLLAPVGLVFVALVAMWLPARRAARVDPMVALRYDGSPGPGSASPAAPRAEAHEPRTRTGGKRAVEENRETVVLKRAKWP